MTIPDIRYANVCAQPWIMTCKNLINLPSDDTSTVEV